MCLRGLGGGERERERERDRGRRERERRERERDRGTGYLRTAHPQSLQRCNKSKVVDTNFRCSLRTHVGYVNIVCNLQKLFRVFTHLAVFRNVNS